MSKKSTERNFLDSFAGAMGWSYSVEEEGEAPDFILSVSERRVGVEVVRVFSDQDTECSGKREDESHRLTWLRRLCEDYYEAGGRPAGLQVQIAPGLFEHALGRIPPDLRKRLLERLLARVRWMKEGATLKSRVRGRHRSLLATLWIRRVPESFGRYSHWRLLNDAMGWVPWLSREHLDDIVAKKAERLGAYQQRVASVVLLIVADGALASGLVRYADGPVAPRGFDAIYLLHHPKGEVQELASPSRPWS
jgi:hypothetical protein